MNEKSAATSADERSLLLAQIREIYGRIAYTDATNTPKLLADFGDELSEQIEADYHTFVIPVGCHWSDVIETSQQTGA